MTPRALMPFPFFSFFEHDWPSGVDRAEGTNYFAPEGNYFEGSVTDSERDEKRKERKNGNRRTMMACLEQKGGMRPVGLLRSGSGEWIL